MIRLAKHALATAGLFALCACSAPVEGLVGQYESSGPAGEPAARLSLRSDGGGGLAAGSVDEPVRWELRDTQVLLHTFRNGAVALTRTDKGLEGDVPGVGRVVLRRK